MTGPVGFVGLGNMGFPVAERLLAAGYPILAFDVRAEAVEALVALGADAVLLGRPQVHALAVTGAQGVAHMIRLLRDELEIAMALAGFASLDAATPDLLQGTAHDPCAEDKHAMGQACGAE